MTKCTACGTPMDPALAGMDTHPCCAPAGDVDELTASRAVAAVFAGSIDSVQVEASTTRQPKPGRPGRSARLAGWSKANPIWRSLVTGPCPDCGEPTPAGWIGHDGRVHREEPTRCLDCIL